MKEAVWTDADDEAARKDGWLVSDAEISASNASGKRRFQLQKHDEDEQNRFEDDDEAWLHVWNRGCQAQSSLEGRALRFLLEKSPEEYEAIAIHAWLHKKAA